MVLLVLLACTAPTDRVSVTVPSLATHQPPVVLSDTAVESPYTMVGFSFVDDTLAGMPQPGGLVPLEQDLDFLVDQQIALLVSLTVTPTDPVAVADAGLDLLHLPIVDFTPPSLEQQIEFVDETTLRSLAGEKVGVHDTAGLGRCGTMLATWFVAGGMDAETAMAEIRRLRPGSIETTEQEQAVRDYAAYLGG